MNNKEIERKFLIKSLPEGLESYPHRRIEQAYLCKSPTIRIRRDGDDYYMTYKGEGLMERTEYNLPLTEDAYEHLLPKADGHIIKKERYVIPLSDELRLELDIFEYPAGLVMAEIEFPDSDAARKFEMLPWFDREVTMDPAYHNSNMI